MALTPNKQKNKNKNKINPHFTGMKIKNLKETYSRTICHFNTKLVHKNTSYLGITPLIQYYKHILMNQSTKIIMTH